MSLNEVNVTEKPEIYLNTKQDGPEGQYVEDIPVCEVTSQIIKILYEDQENKVLYNKLEYHLGESKSAAKAFLNRVFEFRRHYCKKEDGVVYFYSKKVSYPPANLVNDLEYELEIE